MSRCPYKPWATSKRVVIEVSIESLNTLTPFICVVARFCYIICTVVHSIDASFICEELSLFRVATFL